jgi:gas vesicle protein
MTNKTEPQSNDGLGDLIYDALDRLFGSSHPSTDEADAALDALSEIISALSKSLESLQGVASSKEIENLVNGVMHAVGSTVDDIKSKLSPEDLEKVRVHARERAEQAAAAVEVIK